MNNNLKKKIEKKLGRKILKRGDCQYLSERIFDDNNNNLSYNTIRRAFNLDLGSKIKPSKSTLDILSKFVGYNSYDNYNRESNWNDKWALKIKICGWINRMGDDELIYELNLAWSKNDDFAITFVSVLRELLLLEKISLANEIILKSKIDLEDLNYSELVFIGNGVGSVLRKIKVKEEDLILLLNNKFFVDYIFLLFVDYSSLNGYYGLLYSIIQRERINLRLDQYLFFKSVNSFRNLLFKKEIKLIKFLELDKKLLHPILIGRLASIEIAACIKINVNYDYVLDEMSALINNSKNHAIDYLYEIKSISLLMKDFTLMKWISSCEKVNPNKVFSYDKVTSFNKDVLWSDDFPLQEEYHLAHQQYSFILKLILAIKKNEVKKIQIVLRKIDKQKWVLSYHCYLEMFFCIANYHLAKNESDKYNLFNQYNKNCANLNYPIFDEKYLKTYFD